jgi:hypothetical protein
MSATILERNAPIDFTVEPKFFYDLVFEYNQRADKVTRFVLDMMSRAADDARFTAKKSEFIDEWGTENLTPIQDPPEPCWARFKRRVARVFHPRSATVRPSWD